MEYHAIATLVRESTAMTPCDAAARARLAARASELGIAPAITADLLSLWSPEGWVRAEVLQADAADALVWTND